MRRTPLRRHQSLRRKKKSRPMTSADYVELREFVEARDKGICIGITAGIDHACLAPHDAEHLVEQRDIKKLADPQRSTALSDPRLAVFCCRGLNNALHAYARLTLSTDRKRDDLTLDEKDKRARAAIRRHAPDGFEEAVIEYVLETPANRKLGKK